MQIRKSFTLIEVLVVTTIVILITAISILSYSQFMKQSRDSKRKADFELIRNALELYRSNNDSYPVLLTQLLPDFLPKLPQDPKTVSDYSYTILPAGCDGTELQSCTGYNLSTNLENGTVYEANPFGYGNVGPTSIPISTIPSPTSSQLPTSTPVPPTSTPTVTPTNTPGPTSTPTPTSAPSPTPTSTQLPTSTPVPPTATPTPNCPQTCIGAASCPNICELPNYNCNNKVCCYNFCL